jgi:uncharacterized membrane protein YhhN
MMQRNTTIAGITVVILATVTMVASQLLDAGSIGTLAKMTASSAFVALAIGFGAHRAGYGRLILVGLVLSWLGDLALTGDTERQFLLGLGSFLLAHVAYVSAFVFIGINYKWLFTALIPIALLSFGTSIWLAPYVPDALTMPVRVYTTVISLMVIAAFGARGNGAPLIVPIGALLFYFSDLSVAAGQFVQTDFPNFVWGLPFYFAGQVLLALSIREHMLLRWDATGQRVQDQ